jgi:hypothetical protein
VCGLTRRSHRQAHRKPRIDDGEHVFDSRCQLRGCLLSRPIAQLCSDNDAGANVIFTDLPDSFRNPTLRIANQVRHDVGIEQEAHQMSTASGFSSAIAGNCSSSGARVASRASKERGGADSIRIALVFNDFPCQFPDHEAPDEGTFSALRRAAIDRGT